MSDRIKQDDDLRNIAGRTILYRPIIIVEAIEGERQQYRINLTELDHSATEPKMFGIVLSDLIDHIAAAYRDVTGRDERAIRADIFKVMRDEDRFKEKDPARGRQRGLTIKPASN